MTGSTSSAARAGARLQEIADALGIPVTALYDEQPPLPFIEVRDLIREYAAITDPQGRARVMTIIRQEAARCRAVCPQKPPYE